MKKLILLLVSLFVFGGILVGFAAETIEEITVTNTVFKGAGEITSIDANEDGILLICVNPHHSQKKYIMLFDSAGKFLQTVECQANYQVSARFKTKDTIALYRARSTDVYVVDYQGQLLELYTDENSTERSKTKRVSTLTVGEIQYDRNTARTQIIKTENGEKSVFYEVESTFPYFMVYFLIVVLLIVLGSIFVCIQVSKKLRGEPTLLNRWKE